MPRPKKYEDDATRAAAWRSRQHKEHLQAAEIARLAHRLHHILQKAAEQGNDQAAALVGQSVSQTLHNLLQHFQHQP
jgi:hypothetical protein